MPHTKDFQCLCNKGLDMSIASDTNLQFTARSLIVAKWERDDLKIISLDQSTWWHKSAFSLVRGRLDPLLQQTDTCIWTFDEHLSLYSLWSFRWISSTSDANIGCSDIEHENKLVNLPVHLRHKHAIYPCRLTKPALLKKYDLSLHLFRCMYICRYKLDIPLLHLSDNNYSFS